MPVRPGPTVTIRQPVMSLDTAKNRGLLKWISEGRLGSLWHAAVAPQPTDNALALCGSIVDVVEISNYAEPHLVCGKCVTQLNER